MLTDREKFCLAGIAGFLILLVASFAGEPNYEICQRPSEQQTICENYHVLPYLIVKTVRATDRHEGFFAFLTGVAVAFFTGWLVLVGQRADGHFRVSERGYVKLSHFSPGIYWESPRRAAVLYDQVEGIRRWIRVDLRVKNFGKTPADVTEICIAHAVKDKDQKLTERPDYSAGEISPAGRAFLVTDDTFSHPIRREITQADMRDVLKGDKWLYVFGYVEYIDKFGILHRGGYARRFDSDSGPNAPIIVRSGDSLQRTEDVLRRNNLIFIDQPRYNYDITKSPGGSWPET